MNPNKLKGKLVEKNLTYEDCSKILDISTTTFSNKVNGISRFYVCEAKLLSNILELSDLEKIEIFLN
ncbi:TPA: DUF739 domain-containing protein [Clostridioides difficile]|nr:DUF739 domain-containing protein [Clostridioides difficile]HBE9482679.1 DUF739 domain-containing protein [Clostridioides difficile]HBF0312365.1 DUF739 domain-containing protein [Clostridioides difficile]HBG0963166.1 DUF739 domain-containing protein [Clostridioides difficile]HBG7355537.1 DUF739 domain-containing protein [Clostridioides difficile]